jgi:hypothetical protein
VLYAEVMRFGPFRSPGMSTKPSGEPHDEKTLSCRQRTQTAPNATATTRAWRLATARLSFGQTGARRFAAPTPILKYRRPKAAGVRASGLETTKRREKSGARAPEVKRYLEIPGCRESETRCKSHEVDNILGARANQVITGRMFGSHCPDSATRRAELSWSWTLGRCQIACWIRDSKIEPTSPGLGMSRVNAAATLRRYQCCAIWQRGCFQGAQALNR